MSPAPVDPIRVRVEHICVGKQACKLLNMLINTSLRAGSGHPLGRVYAHSNVTDLNALAN